MAIVVVGGQSREVGKTSVVAGLISALPQYNWSAFKITQFGHGRCSLDGKPCSCATEDRCWAITEEKDAAGESDTSRFLAAGAKRSFWVRTEQGRLNEAVSALRKRIADSENAILESNSIVALIEPDLYLTVLDGTVGDFKPSALRLLGRANAVLVRGSSDLHAQRFPHAKIFHLEQREYMTAEITNFVRGRMQEMCAPSVKAR